MTTESAGPRGLGPLASLPAPAAEATPATAPTTQQDTAPTTTRTTAPPTGSAPAAPQPAAAPATAPTGPPGTAATRTATGTAIPAQGAGTGPAAARRHAAARHGARAWPLVATDALAGAGAAAWLLGPAPPGAATLVAALLVLAGLHGSAGLFRPGPLATTLGALPQLAGHTAVAWCVACALTAAVSPAAAVDGGTLLALIAAHTLGAAVARGALRGVRRRRMRRHPCSALVIAAGEPGRTVVRVLHEHPEYGLRPVGLVPSGPEPAPDGCPLPVLETPGEIVRAMVQNAVRDAVVLRRPGVPEDPALLRLCWDQGCTVWLVDHGPPGDRPGEQRPGPDGHLWGFACRRLDPPRPRRIARFAKRLLDVAAAALALLLAAPLLAGCALAVRLADGPGVLFRQQRVGEDGRPFVMLKFRTLRADPGESDTRWTIAGDARVSGVGRLLRRTSLDELPQLWNVLRGDMSLVGPRPERPHFVAEFSHAYPGYAQRHRMPAGLTGLAQISGLRGDTSIEDRARFDNHYIDSWSLWQDLCIMLRTGVGRFRGGD